MKKTIKILLANILICSLILVVLPATAFSQEIQATREYTIHQFVRIILPEGKGNATLLSDFSDQNEISSYAKGSMAKALEANIVSGYDDSTLRPQAKILRVEAMALLSRVLPADLPEQEKPIDFSDTPSWAKKEILKLTKLGLLKGYGNGLMGANDLLTKEQVGILVARLKKYYPLRIQDDFYQKVNQEWLENTSLEYGPSVSSMSEAYDVVLDREMELFKNLLENRKDYPSHTKEGKMIEYFMLAQDFDARKKEGIGPLKQPIEAIQNLKSIEDLLPLLSMLEKDFGVDTFFPVGLSVDLNDSRYYAMYLYEPVTGLSKSYYEGFATQQVTKAYLSYIKYLLKLVGYTEKDATSLSTEIYNMEKRLALVKFDAETHYDPNQTNNPMDREALEKMMKIFDINRYLTEIKVEADEVIVRNPEAVLAAQGELREDNLSAIKGYLLFTLLNYYSRDLTLTVAEEAAKLTTLLYGYDTTPTEFSLAFYETEYQFASVLGELYAKEHYTKEMEVFVMQMAKDLIQVFSKRILANKWMSEHTKIEAIGKLGALMTLVGGPTTYYDDFEKLSISYEKDRYLNKKIEIDTYFRNYMKNYVGFEVRRDSFVFPSTTVNAFYDPTRNVIMIPAGILTIPLFDPKASYEENLGKVGVIIAHEITHALDDNGAKYDRMGTLHNVWTKEDYEAYGLLGALLVDRFDGFSIGEGLFVNGNRTLSENIADLGAVRLITDLAIQKNLDLKTLYTAYAKLWREKATGEYNKILLEHDTHAPNQFRVNGILPNLPEFLSAFEIEENDELFLKEDVQIEIW